VSGILPGSAPPPPQARFLTVQAMDARDFRSRMFGEKRFVCKRAGLWHSDDGYVIAQQGLNAADEQWRVVYHSKVVGWGLTLKEAVADWQRKKK
jgi:hypothetical protein